MERDLQAGISIVYFDLKNESGAALNANLCIEVKCGRWDTLEVSSEKKAKFDETMGRVLGRRDSNFAARLRLPLACPDPLARSVVW